MLEFLLKMSKIRTNLTVIGQAPRKYDWGTRANFPITSKDLKVARTRSHDYPSVTLTPNAMQVAFERFVADGVVCVHNVARAVQDFVVDRVSKKVLCMAQRALQYKASMQIVALLEEKFPDFLKPEDRHFFKPKLHLEKRNYNTGPHCDHEKPTVISFSHTLTNGELYFVDARGHKPSDEIDYESGFYSSRNLCLKRWAHFPQFVPEGQHNQEYPIIICADGVSICHGARGVDKSRRRYLQKIELVELKRDWRDNCPNKIAPVPSTYVHYFIHSIGFP